MKTFLFFVSIFSLYGCFSKDKNSLQSELKPTTAVIKPTLSTVEIAKYHHAIDSFLKHTLYRTRFNGSVLVAKNGVIVYEGYVGYKDLRAKDSLTAETPLQIASTSKTLTSAAVLQLVQQGKLDLNAPLQQFFPDLPYEGITVKMLLDHRSGLPNYLNYMEQMGWNRRQLATNADVVSTLINWHPAKMAFPDRRFYYCNTNYVLLATIVEKVSGMPFPQYMKEHIFEPLGMNHTFIRTASDTTQVTNSYQPNGNVWTLDFSDGPYGDKNVFSTPRDLLKWDQAVYNGTIVGQQLLDSAFVPYSNEKKSMHNYGLGWRLLDYPNGKRVIYHNGHWHGFNSAFARLTDEKATIIILGNQFNKYIYTAAKKMYNLFGNYDGTGEPEGAD